MISYDGAPSVDGLRSAHRELLTPSFRPGELLPQDAFLAQFPGQADALLAQDDEGRIQGIAVMEQFHDVVLLQYLAASPAARGRGVGSGLLDAVLSDRAPGSVLMLAEFDRPDAHASHPLHGDPTARLRFYARFGALALDLPYFQPALSAATPRQHGMLLAAFDRDGTIAARGRLDATQARAVHSYLEEILDGADDPDAQRLRDAAAVDGGIRALTLDRYAEIARSPL
ncbi:GNAT family N-acetyltransferase [Microbacterium tenebrionis]|uniref:GNAT family N-acetyltransferase n=1 Tax=Microbacterium tenebrionis TaxID=2830665 RepID=UPI00158A9508|nr:GNAT family N-acetyltransferase [Microbacterium ihumii]